MLNSSFDDDYKKKKIVKNNPNRSSNNLEKTQERKRQSGKIKENIMNAPNTGSSGGTLLGQRQNS